jgi:uncharacterized membrane protein YobD (UPF0266 family)
MKSRGQTSVHYTPITIIFVGVIGILVYAGVTTHFQNPMNIVTVMVPVVLLVLAFVLVLSWRMRPNISPGDTDG